MPDEPAADPFGERQRLRYRTVARVLGGEFHFESAARELLRLVERAYAGLPAQRFAAAVPRFTVRLVLGQARARGRRAEPAAVQPLAAGAVVCGALAGSSFMSISATGRAGLIVVAPELLRFPYHLRYELIEFAVYCLAARAQQLVPLHAACIGGRRGGALVLGASGAGKSTLMLHGLRSGLRFLAEDSVLVRARGLLATGVANFLHVRADSLRFLAGTPLARQIRAAPVIVRRSGVRKYEFDLRGGDFRLAGAPVPLQALVFLSARRARDGALLRRLPAATLAARLRRAQPYAAHQPGWEAFLVRARRLPAFELRRGSHPRAAVAALAQLLEGPQAHVPERRSVRRRAR